MPDDLSPHGTRGHAAAQAAHGRHHGHHRDGGALHCRAARAAVGLRWPGTAALAKCVDAVLDEVFEAVLVRPVDEFQVSFPSRLALADEGDEGA